MTYLEIDLDHLTCELQGGHLLKLEHLIMCGPLPADKKTRHHCTSTPLVTSSLPTFLVFISFTIQDRDDDGENDIAWTDPSSGVTFLVDKRTGHSYPRTSLSRRVDEDNAQAVNSARRTIASANSGDNEVQAPQWILDALKVGTGCAESNQPLKTHRCHGRTTPHISLKSSQYLPSINDFQIFSPNILRLQCVPHTLVAQSLSPSTKLLHGVFRGMTSPI